MYTVDYTFSYRNKKFICACSDSSANAHGMKFRGGNLNILKLSKDAQGNGRFAIESQGRTLISDSSQRMGISP